MWYGNLASLWFIYDQSCCHCLSISLSHLDEFFFLCLLSLISHRHLQLLSVILITFHSLYLSVCVCQVGWARAVRFLCALFSGRTLLFLFLLSLCNITNCEWRCRGRNISLYGACNRRYINATVFEVENRVFLDAHRSSVLIRDFNLLFALAVIWLCCSFGVLYVYFLMYSEMTRNSVWTSFLSLFLRRHKSSTLSDATTIVVLLHAHEFLVTEHVTWMRLDFEFAQHHQAFCRRNC